MKPEVAEIHGIQLFDKLQLPSGWEFIPMGELSTIRRGASPRPAGDPRYFGDGEIPWIKIGDVTKSYGRYVETTAEHVNEEGATRSVRIPPDSLIIANSGVSLGFAAITKVEGCIHDGWLLVTDLRGLDQNYLFYCINILTFKLRNYAEGTTQPNLNTGIARRLLIPTPPLPEQKAIAHILGSLDDKIELNRRMNETLEGMAQALFKSWFVDFDPVIDNALAAGNPISEEFAARAETRRQALADGTANRQAAEQFPSAFQETDEMGWIPVGWIVKSFNTLAKLDTTSVKPFQQPETMWEHYSIPSYDSSGMPSLDKGAEIKSNKYMVKPGAILSSKLNPETERTWWPFMMDEKASICSTEFMQFVPHHAEEQAFVYSLIRSEPFQANILERVTGSTGSRQRAQPKQIAEIDIIDCGESLRAEYIKVALPLFKSTLNNSIQSQSLAKLRDTLLPKLISGELRIEDAEKMVGEMA